MRLIVTSYYRFGLAARKSIDKTFKKKGQPKRQNLLTPEDKEIQYSPWQAFQLMRLHSFSNFQETVDVVFHLGVNPKHGDHLVRGSAFMPAGIGKQTKVAVLCPPHMEQQLQDKVDMFVDDQVLKGFQRGAINFETMFTTPQLLQKLKPFGRLLGPRGLMPNAKVGTLVKQQNLKEAIERAKFGQVSFRVDPQKNLHAKIGKVSFTDEQLLMNFKALVTELVNKKPEKARGKYIREVFLKSTMGPRWRLSPQQVDPKNSKNIWALLN